MSQLTNTLKLGEYSQKSDISSFFYISVCCMTGDRFQKWRKWDYVIIGSKNVIISSACMNLLVVLEHWIQYQYCTNLFSKYFAWEEAYYKSVSIKTGILDLTLLANSNHIIWNIWNKELIYLHKIWKMQH